MNNCRLVSSLYYPTESKPKKNHERDAKIMTGSPHGPEQLFQAAQQAQMELMRAKKRVPPVVEHYFAPKPVVEGPLIESSYFTSGANYSLKFFTKKKEQILSDIAVPENAKQERCAPVMQPVIPIESYNVEPIGSPQSHCPIHHQQVINIPQTTYSTGPTVTPVTNSSDSPLRKEIVTKKKTKATDKYSEYAYISLERKKREQYGLNADYGLEQELPPADVSAPLEMGQFNQCIQQPIEPPALIYKEEVPEQPIQPELKAKKSVDSLYFGIPNDLYPAYRKKLEPYMIYDEPPTKPYEIHNTVIAPRDEVPQPSGIIVNNMDSDIEGCDTAQENPLLRSRFVTQMKQKEIPPPLETPSVPRYMTQYSSIGNAFAPVGQAQVSEYHYEDLNDLASCIDAI
ncbi:hypothetical protein RB195_020649 [Necator americanus]|uniref:Zasp-like motif domain-containing protein n=1 Tax=Necator americanus TaxID=51031 RepID=A0ABR1CK31_NECAM